MTGPVLRLSSSAQELLGDVRALAAAARGAGPPEAQESLGLLVPTKLETVASWRAFLDRYLDAVLVPWEWPLIAESHRLATLGQAREMVAADQAWSRSQSSLPSELRLMGEASFRVGQRQLSRLRSLPDQRVVRRYLAAIEAGEARGWHPLVYGLVLATFAIPLRQGLQHYARQTATGFLLGTPLAERLDEGAQSQLLDEVEGSLIPALQRLLPAGIQVTG